MLRKLPYILATTALTAASAFAGGMNTPVETPQVTYASPSSPASPNWSGGYVGAQLGYGDVGTSIPGIDGNDVIGGFVAGYDYDFGTWVAGAGIDYDFANIDLAGAATLENVLRLKARGGYKAGNGLLYATAGYAQAYTDTLGDDGGYFAGVGYEHRITSSFGLGGEVLYHEFSDFNGTGIDVNATTLQLRGTFRF